MELQDQIYQLVKVGQYKEALSHFKINKEQYNHAEIASDAYLTGHMLQCMRMTRAWNAAEKYLQIYGIAINHETSERVLTAWILTLYDQYKSLGENEGPHKGLIGKISSTLPLLASLESEFSESLYNNVVARILKTESKKMQPDWQLIGGFCASVNPDKLNSEPHKITINQKGVEKESELSSLLEEWYAQYSKSLLSIADYKKCIAVSEEALEKIKRMHYSNDIWFARRIAQSHAKLGKTETAIAWFEKILKRKNDWFLLSETAALHKMKGDLEKALVLMRQAMAKPGDINFKVEIIERLGDIYAELKDESTAKDHWQLAVSIRRCEGWKIDRELESKAAGATENEDASALKQSLIRKLRTVWADSQSAAKSADSQRMGGKVSRMSTPKEAGVDIWIRATDGKEFYAFIRRNDEIFTNLKVGTSVSFHMKPIADRPLDRAVGIKEIR